MSTTFGKICAVAALCLLVAGCGTLVDMSSNAHPTVDRRLYVSDPAANDSLPRALLHSGVMFVMQPAKAYQIRLSTSAQPEVLQIYRDVGGRFQFQGTDTGTVAGNTQTFSLASDQTGAAYFLALLTTPTGAVAVEPDSVHLVPAAPVEAHALRVKLLLVRQLYALPDSATKVAFAQKFLQTLASIYADYGITLQGSYSIVEPTAAPLKLNFGASDDAIPGTRDSAGINLYLVDSIYVPAGTTAGGEILGFAPREAFDLNSDDGSRMILSAQGIDDPSTAATNGAVAVATTAAHEMGHFFGFRHTTASNLDLQGDDDYSNRDDGFASTPVCNGLSKAPARPVNEITLMRKGHPYCLRVAGDFNECSCPDAYDLMFPYSCSSTLQRTLGADQQLFLRKNMTMFER